MSTGLCQRLVIPLPILLTTDTASSTCFSGQPCIFADFDLFPYIKVYQSGQVDATPVQQKKCTALRCSEAAFTDSLNGTSFLGKEKNGTSCVTCAAMLK